MNEKKTKELYIQFVAPFAKRSVYHTKWLKYILRNK